MTPLRLVEHVTAMAMGEIETMKKKNHDYSGAETDALRNFKLAEYLDICASEAGILVRMCDKMARIANLLRYDAAVSNESIHDTISDLRNYAGILDAQITDREAPKASEGPPVWHTPETMFKRTRRANKQ